ncbi:MAG: Synechococcus phage, partial [Pseudomonadota bacterium]
EYMLKNNIQNSFWHQEDDFTITSSGYIWTYPNKSITSQSIIVDLNKNWKTKNYNCFGVCVDFVY